MEYITIAAYAAAAQISKAAAYNRAKNPKYKGYFRKINGILMVDDSILEFNNSINIDSTIESPAAPRSAQNQFNHDSTEHSTIESTLIESLRQQLQKQEERITELLSMLAEKDRIIAQLSGDISKITANIQSLQHEQHLLEAGKIQTGAQPPAAAAPTEEKSSSKKKGLFSRFWRL